jgi:hypothetical protein
VFLPTSKKICQVKKAHLQQFAITHLANLDLTYVRNPKRETSELWQTVRHGYPWVPTDQAHSRFRQVGPTHQKIHRHVSRPTRPDTWARREEDSLACKPRKSRRTKAARISFPYCNRLEIGFPVVTDLNPKSTDLVCQPI